VLSQTKLLHWDPAEHIERIPDMVLPSNGEDYSTPGISQVNLLTVNHIPHILEKTIDDLEGLRRSYPILILTFHLRRRAVPSNHSPHMHSAPGIFQQLRQNS
jgi:hypothetical protein